MRPAESPSSASRLPAAPMFAAEDYSDALIAQSRQRSLEIHRLDPGGSRPPRVLPASTLREHRMPLEPLLDVAHAGMETLFQQVRDAGYVLLLTDAHGVAVDFMTNPVLDSELRRAGLMLGGRWSEDLEGTSAVGLCALGARPITVHQREHFRAAYKSLSCSAAPILAPDGRLLAVLDATALYSPEDKRSQHLVLQMVGQTARMIENANFLRHFERHWVLRLHARREFVEVATEGLLAFDGGGKLVAANTRFLHDMGCSPAALADRDVEDLFGIRFDDLAAAARDGSHSPLMLRLLHSGRQCYALQRAPRSAAKSQVAHVEVGSRRPAPRGDGGAALAALAGTDARMLANVARALRVVDKDITVLLHGESGTGKEAFAKAMHAASARAAAPFVALNCAAIPESLIESELFGYREGAFTGARVKGVRGKIVQAHGGTLFLDEIGDMPLGLQTRLLRVLAEREVMPLGAEQPTPVDLQVVCATHRDLAGLVEDGRFRLDLYYRVNALTLTLPALRDRTDKAGLIDAVLSSEAATFGRRAPRVGAEAMALLLGHPWPGNVRELKNTLRTALALGDGGTIAPEHLAAVVPGMPRSARPPERLASLGFCASVGEDAEATRDPEREVLLGALRQQHWNISQAARVLQTCRATVYRRMRRFGIVAPNQRE